MEIFLTALAGTLTLGVIYAWHRYFYDYQITHNHLTVTWLGIRVRRIRLQDIESISKRRKFARENWANTWKSRHRILVIRKRSGLRRDIVITPQYRYEFRNQLEATMAKLSSSEAEGTRAESP